MAVLLTCDSIAKSFGSRTVFTGISLSLHEGERLGIIGPNGAGKSTFLQVLSGRMPPDDGAVSQRKGVRLAMVVQDPAFDAAATVHDIVLAAAAESDDRETDVAKVLSRVGFEDASAAAGTLSGGWRKRLAIAVAMAEKPDVLLLDEPTNHLDVAGILWLEKLVNDAPFASVFVTHDRYFLENCSTRVAEINRSYPLGLFAVPGTYSKFLEKRSEFLRAQQRQQEALENLVEREVEWLRRGAKARTTKSKARIQDAMELKAQLADVTSRSVSGTSTVDFSATGRLTKRLVVCEGVSKSMGGRLLFRGVSFVLGPGARLGLLGANGSGKSTLLRLLVGELAPDAGEIRLAEGLRVAYFDQNRDRIDPELPLRRALAPEGDTVIFRERPIHVAGWAARFLFRAEQLDLAVKNLSGGERARVHIARLMLQPADILILDEPTNDLDIPTLEVLESNLGDFPGALVLVTHDRFLLDRLTSTLLALDGEGGAEFFAELAQWEQANAAKKMKAVKAAPVAAKGAEPAKKKLSYMEAREWEQIEGKIEEAEAGLAAARGALEDPSIVADPGKLTEAAARLDAAQAEVDRLYERWSELSVKAGR
ncbi:MAG TPA: ABC-F family ATP-binding cassette domain-containing protein [Bryobacteraceae bacterium]|jgi:ATP-binding cassette subfamily F protein uup|nr:ABC-F family ATP-binding cassette domain-containing protein [Bryobacteraceae bacterium]